MSSFMKGAIVATTLSLLSAPTYAADGQSKHHTQHQEHAVYGGSPDISSAVPDNTLEQWIMQTYPRSGNYLPGGYGGGSEYGAFPPPWYYPPGWYGSFGGPPEYF